MENGATVIAVDLEAHSLADDVDGGRGELVAHAANALDVDVARRDVARVLE